jgi:hypothetical protein
MKKNNQDFKYPEFGVFDSESGVNRFISLLANELNELKPKE